MKTAIVVLFVFGTSFAEMYCVFPCYNKVIYCYPSFGISYGAIDNPNTDWILGGPLKNVKHTQYSASCGLGFEYVNQHYSNDLSYGIDFLYSINSVHISDATLTGVKGVTNSHDTIPADISVLSDLLMRSIVLSPSITYRFPYSHFFLSFRPRFIFFLDPETKNTYKPANTNFASFIGNSALRSDVNQKLITEYSYSPNLQRRIDFNMVFSFGYSYVPEKMKECCDCCPLYSNISLRFDLLIGLSPTGNSNFFLYPGLSINLAVPIYSKSYQM